MKIIQKYSLLGLIPLTMAGCGVSNDNVVQAISGDTILLQDIKTGKERAYIVGKYDEQLHPIEYSLLSIGDTVFLGTTTQKWYDSNLIFKGQQSVYDHAPDACLGFYKNYKAIKKTNDFAVLKQSMVLSDTNTHHK